MVYDEKVIFYNYLYFITSFCCICSSQLHVVAMDEFKTDKPSKNISVRVLEQSELGRYQIGTNAVLNCQVLRIVDPKRGKRNATFL